MPKVSLEKQNWLSHERLLQLLYYDEASGRFYNRITVGSRIAGRESGSVRTRGYWVVSINKRPFMRSRLVWFYVHGVWPTFNIDHINGVPLDDRLENLRDIPQSANVARARYPSKPNGPRGVSFKANGWEANIKVAGKAKYLGRYKTEAEAKAAYDQAFELAFGTTLLNHPAPPTGVATPPDHATYVVSKPPRPPLTPERLRECVSYDPETGVFTRIYQKCGRVIAAGAVAGSMNQEGYRHIKIDGRSYVAQRLAWFWTTGVWPDGFMDHINGDPGDNSFLNLRLADASQSVCNRGLFSNNKAGIKGVMRQGKRWRATIQYKDVRYRRSFDTPEEAQAAYADVAKKLHGEFARKAKS